ncbi:MAG: hypothetical protein QM627_03455 [Luteolibacter sp.]
MLLVAGVFAAWAWFRPYEWKPDPAANSKVVWSLVSRDHSHYWLTVHVKVEPGKSHDFQKPVRLISESRELEAADTTLSGDADQSVTELWFKFWLTHDEMASPLFLQINDGRLTVKKSSDVPELAPGKPIYRTSCSW